MADSVKMKALSAIENVIAAVPGIGTVIRNPSKPIDKDQAVFDLAFVYDEQEGASHVNQYTFTTLPVQIEVWMTAQELARADMADRLAADIERALLSDKDVRRWCNDIRPDPENSVTKFYTDEFLGGFVSRYIVRFLHGRGDPYDKAI